MSMEDRILSSIGQSIHKQIANTHFIDISLRDRPKLPASFMAKAWALVDEEALLGQLAERLEKELVDKLVKKAVYNLEKRFDDEDVKLVSMDYHEECIKKLERRIKQLMSDMPGVKLDLGEIITLENSHSGLVVIGPDHELSFVIQINPEEK